MSAALRGDGQPSCGSEGSEGSLGSARWQLPQIWAARVATTVDSVFAVLSAKPVRGIL